MQGIGQTHSGKIPSAIAAKSSGAVVKPTLTVIATTELNRGKQ
jgi:hypothetical protein